ncbi:hypothetical protein SAMN05660199_04318 [Klenkia soli]|uniref:Uncharacterized protein n=1 Tax=Klenkia soli TaxID=1052260 RepID=A0A1H0TYH0_9ACTN|nr:hypothetical protein [Klenkia soli]SDP59132.1 hypothetical protein SAMN05660199_04318 [Klenkia soli]
MPGYLPLRGWTSTPAPGEPGWLDVTDGAGVQRARVSGLRRRRTTAAARQTLTVHLPDGSTTPLRNGTRWWGTRRARTRGLLTLGGVSYVLQHRTGRRARVLRDGAWLSTLLRSAPGPAIEVRAPHTPDDELATALFAHVLRPGRASVLGGVAEVLASGP